MPRERSRGAFRPDPVQLRVLAGLLTAERGRGVPVLLTGVPEERLFFNISVLTQAGLVEAVPVSDDRGHHLIFRLTDRGRTILEGGDHSGDGV